MTSEREAEIRKTLASIPPAERDPHDVAIAELLDALDARGTSSSADDTSDDTSLSFELSLRVNDGGQQRCQFGGVARHQGELAKQIAYAIRRAISCMNCPPALGELVYAMEHDWSSVFGVLGYLHEHWTGVDDFDAGIRIEVDLDCLLAEAEDDEIADVKSMLSVLQGQGCPVKFEELKDG